MLDKQRLRESILEARKNPMQYIIITVPTPAWVALISDKNEVFKTKYKKTNAMENVHMFSDYSQDGKRIHYIEGAFYTETVVNEQEFNDFTYKVYPTLAK